MASRRQRNRRKRRAAEPTGDDPAAGAEPAEGSTGEPEAGRPGQSGRRPGSGGRFSQWADRIEQTADERPPAPWGAFPLGPISVLAGLVLLVIGAIGSNPVQLAIGVALGSLGGLELSIREHFAGFRSHTTLLAGFVFVIVVGLTYYAATVVLWACLLIGLVIASLTFWALRKAFEKASGGLSYRLR